MAGIPLQGGQRIAAAHVVQDLTVAPGPSGERPTSYASSDGFDASVGIDALGQNTFGSRCFTLTLSQHINYARSIIVVTPKMIFDPTATIPLNINDLGPCESGAVGGFPDPTVSEGNTITIAINSSQGGELEYGDFFVAVYKIN